jgi:hypothetical protein
MSLQRSVVSAEPVCITISAFGDASCGMGSTMCFRTKRPVGENSTQPSSHRKRGR